MLTKSVCPICKKDLSAEIIQHKENAYLQKTCATHGQFLTLLSVSGKKYIDLRTFYNKLTTKNTPAVSVVMLADDPVEKHLMQDKYYIKSKDRHITGKELKDTLEKQQKRFIIICDSDKTDKDTLKEAVVLAKKQQKTAFVFSETKKLTDYNYITELMQSGLKRIYVSIKNLEHSQEALKNLKEAKLSTVLTVPLSKSSYKKNLPSFFEYTLKNKSISEINFYCEQDKFNKKISQSAPDKAILLLEEKYKDIISLEKVYLFMKLHYLYMHLIKRSTCFNFWHFWIIRHKKGFLPISELLQLKDKEKQIEKIASLIEQNKSFKAKISIVNLFLVLSFSVIKHYKFILPKLSHMFFYNLLNIRSKYTDASADFIHIIFSSCCTPFNFDADSAKNCMTGVIWKHPEKEIKTTDRRYKYLQKYWK